MSHRRSFTTRLTLAYAAMVTATVVIVLVVGRIIVGHQLIRGLDLLNAAEFVGRDVELGSLRGVPATTPVGRTWPVRGPDCDGSWGAVKCR